MNTTGIEMRDKEEANHSLQLDTNRYGLPDVESALIANFVNTTADLGHKVDPITVINLYVSLKSKPKAILVGQRERGKIALIESLVKVLIPNDPNRRQFINGHAWWAERNSNVSLIQAQTNYNDEKILTLIENAWRPERNNRAYIVCLARISPAEVSEYFSVVGRHYRSSKVLGSSSINFFTTVPFPDNLCFIGTMDAHQFQWYSDDLLSQTTIILWPDTEDALNAHYEYAPMDTDISLEREFLHSRIRTEQSAYSKLQLITSDQQRALLPLIEVERAIMSHGIEFSMRSVTNEVIVYLANAWTEGGRGLFAPSPQRNLKIALDLAISQIVFPRGWKVLSRSVTLREALRSILNDQYKNSLNFLDRLEFIS